MGWAKRRASETSLEGVGGLVREEREVVKMKGRTKVLLLVWILAVMVV